MAWYIWFLIGLFGGGTAGLFSAGLLHCSKEAGQRAALLRRLRESMTDLELREYQKKYGLEEVGI
jgi:hypothetical protein